MEKIVERKINMGVLAWGTSWSEIEPNKGEFKFAVFDKHLDFLKQNEMLARGGILHPAGLPEWLKNGNYSREEVAGILKEHINQVMRRHKGEVEQWIVINEPYIYPYRKDDVFYKAFTGDDYIDLAFQYARHADPTAILIYNDSHNHSESGEEGLTTKLTRRIVNRLKEKGLIDGVGLQMHLDGAKPPTKQDVIITMRSYGVPVYVTEFDVNMREVSGSTQEIEILQAYVYQKMIIACLESEVCKSFTTWEIGDKYSWLEYPTTNFYTSPDANPTMYDDNLNPKAAYYAVQRAFLDHFTSVK